MRKKEKSEWSMYRIQLSSRTEYKQWRRFIFERDNYTCQKCNTRGGELNAHHIKPAKQYPNLILNKNNGMTCKGVVDSELSGIGRV